MAALGGEAGYDRTYGRQRPAAWPPVHRWAPSANDEQGKLWRTTVPHQPGNLMPVKVVSVNLCQQLGDPETLEL
jgi:hypothetical protein